MNNRGFIQFLIPFFLTLLVAGVLAIVAGYVWQSAIPLLAHLGLFALAGYMVWVYLLPLLSNMLKTRSKISYYEMIAVTVAVIVLFGLSLPGLVFSPVGDFVANTGGLIVPENPSLGFAVIGLTLSILATLYIRKRR
jgi:hypothetical protein